VRRATITVDTDATCAALKDVFEDTRSILEPAGALSVAGVKAWCGRHRMRDRTFVAIACGAGAVRLLRLQREGKGAMESRDFRRGFPLPKGTEAA